MEREKLYGIRWSEWQGEGENRRLIVCEQGFDSRVRMVKFLDELKSKVNFHEELARWHPGYTVLTEYA